MKEGLLLELELLLGRAGRIRRKRVRPQFGGAMQKRGVQRFWKGKKEKMQNHPNDFLPEVSNSTFLHSATELWLHPFSAYAETGAATVQ